MVKVRFTPEEAQAVSDALVEAHGPLSSRLLEAQRRNDDTEHIEARLEALRTAWNKVNNDETVR